MPGKPPANRGGKEKDESSSVSSGELGAEKSKKYSIWPKWTEEELSAEKWGVEAGSISKGTAGEVAGRPRKGTTVTASGQGDKKSEEGILPSSLSSSDVEWVNPGMYILHPRTPVIVAEPDASEIDLTSNNRHLMRSELMCSIISQLQALWHSCGSASLAVEGPGVEKKEWRPWDLIYHSKDHPVPLFNPIGKYCVRIFWMGSWRKICVTDQLPLKRLKQTITSEEGSAGTTVDDSEAGERGEKRLVLLPRTANTAELWPVIVAKAILKVAALDYKGGQEWSEYGDCSIIHMLTGWCPQSLPTRIDTDLLWAVLCRSLPLWKRPPEDEEGGEGREGREVEAPTAALSDAGAERGTEGGGRDAREKRSAIVMAEFTTACDGRPLTKAKEALMIASLALLKDTRLISDQFDPQQDQACPMLITHVRDIPLEAPPKEPPPIKAPEEHAWLGYKERRHAPWEPPPPKPHTPRWVEIIPPFLITSDPTDPLTSTETEDEEQLHKEEQSGPPGDPSSTATVAEQAGREPSEGSGTDAEVKCQKSEVKPTGIWMKYEDFRKAFSSVEVFTSPSCFKYSHSYKDLMATVENVNVEETKGKGRASQSPANKISAVVGEADDTNILYMEEKDEETGPAELHFVFTCLSNWKDGSKNMKTERKKSIGLKLRRTSILANPMYSMRSSAPAQYNYMCPWRGGGHAPHTIPETEEDEEGDALTDQLPPSPTYTDPPVAQEDEEKILPGSLIVEEFDWKCIESKLPMLRLITTGVKGAVMKLDNRTRIFRLHVKAPIGYYLSISSNTNFVLTNEDGAYNCMHKEGIGFSKVYSGPIPALQPNSWAAVFREVLIVRRTDQLLSFRLDCPVPGHLLRVVDNDEEEEIPRIAHVTQPQLYGPNRHGYTILCEMWTHSEPVQEGSNWRLRVVSSRKELPLCEGQEEEDEMGDGEGEEGERGEKGEKGEGEEGKKGVVGIAREFYHKEIRDYCLPDRDHVIFRYSMKVSQDCPITVQLRTSKKDAYIKLEILDGETVVAVTEGRSYCFIPMCQLLSHSTHTAEDTAESSSATLGSQPASTHKYVVTATIIRDSWPIADTAWSCIADIKMAEEAAEKAAGTGGKGDGKKTPSTSKGSKGKKGKGGGGSKESGDRVQSSVSLSSIDASKPHWTLRVALRQSDKENFEMCKDTEKEDELKSMQTAWETQQPGRLKKGQESRQKFLDAHALKNSSEGIGSSIQLSTSSSLLPPQGPVPLQRIDLSLYTRYSHTTPHILTAEELSKREEERRETIRQYRAWRHAILQSRDQDRQLRNEEKLKQLEEAEKQQTDLELTRKRMNRVREKIRQRCLAEERARREAEQAAQKAAEEEAAAGARDSKAKGKKGKKK